MTTIFNKSGEEFNQNSFNNQILTISSNYQKERKALAFALLIYKDVDFTLSKIMKDEEYWSTLDIISGQNLSVFYIKSKTNYYKSRQEKFSLEEKKESLTKAGFLKRVTLGSESVDDVIKFIKNEFEIYGKISTPFIFFFQIDGLEIIDYFIVNLKAEKVEDGFLEIKDIFNNASKSIKDVTPENYQNYQEIFNLIKDGVNQGKVNSILFNRENLTTGIGSIFTIIQKLFPS